jgi:hypothetical protein
MLIRVRNLIDVLQLFDVILKLFRGDIMLDLLVQNFERAMIIPAAH